MTTATIFPQTLKLSSFGCGAFDPAQRDSVRDSTRTIKEYTELGDTDRAHELLEQIWRLMDEKDEISWDWQKIAYAMRKDF
jgi:hypothetical protein